MFVLESDKGLSLDLGLETDSGRNCGDVFTALPDLEDDVGEVGWARRA